MPVLAGHSGAGLRQEEAVALPEVAFAKVTGAFLEVQEGQKAETEIEKRTG